MELRDEAARGLREPSVVETFIDLVQSGELGSPAEAPGTAFTPSRHSRH